MKPNIESTVCFTFRLNVRALFPWLVNSRHTKLLQYQSINNNFLENLHILPAHSGMNSFQLDSFADRPSFLHIFFIAFLPVRVSNFGSQLVWWRFLQIFRRVFFLPYSWVGIQLVDQTMEYEQFFSPA